jgi:hypothetical protein
MTTIAPPRPRDPRHASTLADVTNTRTYTPLRHTQRKLGPSGSPSLRTSYLTASLSEGKEVQALPILPQRVTTAQAQTSSAIPSNAMGPTHGYEELSSGLSSASSCCSVASSDSVNGQPAALAEPRSGLVGPYRSSNFLLLTFI